MPAHSQKNDPSLPWQVSQILDGDLFRLKTNDGFVVGRRVDGELLEKRDRNWPTVAGGAAAGPLQTDGATAGSLPDAPRTLVAEGNGVEFLKNYSSKDHIWQVFGGIDWPLARVFQEVPLGTKQGNLTKNLTSYNLAAAAWSTWGWTWTGYQSMIGDQRRISMFLLPYDISVGFAVANEASYAHLMQFEWLINKVKYEALHPLDKEEAKLIVDVLRGRIDAVNWSPGLKGFPYSPGFREVFGVDPVVLKGTKVFAKTENGDVLINPTNPATPAQPAGGA